MKKKVLSIILALSMTVVMLAGCGDTKESEQLQEAETKVSDKDDATNKEQELEPDLSQPVSDGNNTQEGTEDVDKVKSEVEIKALSTLDGLVCVFITNNSQTVIDELRIQVNFKDDSGNVIDMGEDGHDMILPGYTVISRIDAPESYATVEPSVDIKLGVHPKYENHSEQVSVESNQGEDCVILQITNNSEVTIEEIEYAVILYKGNEIVTVGFPQDVYDTEPGDTRTEKYNTYGQEYDRFEVYLNQAHTFGL